MNHAVNYYEREYRVASTQYRHSRVACGTQGSISSLTDPWHAAIRGHDAIFLILFVLHIITSTCSGLTTRNYQYNPAQPASGNHQTKSNKGKLFSLFLPTSILQTNDTPKQRTVMMNASEYNPTATATEVKTGVPLGYEGSAIGTIHEPGTDPTIIVIPADHTEVRHGPHGHSFLGCMCDMRRAVIIVNIISLTFVIIGMIAFIVVSSPKYREQYDDHEDAQEDFDDLDEYRGAIIALLIISFFIHISGIVGGVRFSRWMVLMTGVWLSLGCFFNLLGLNFIAAVVYGLFAYPHFIFFREIQMGIMSTENYTNEAQSCCCVV